MKAVGWLESGEVRWLRDMKPESDTTLFVQTPEVEEDREPIGYKLLPIYAPRKGYVATAAFILCHSCGDAISGSGGPSYNSICLKCAEHLNFTNLIKGK
jgi:hypothetical protein